VLARSPLALRALELGISGSLPPKGWERKHGTGGNTTREIPAARALGARTA
jgi:hypothetical protein